jgi:hypothetical protein
MALLRLATAILASVVGWLGIYAYQVVLVVAAFSLTIGGSAVGRGPWRALVILAIAIGVPVVMWWLVRVAAVAVTRAIGRRDAVGDVRRFVTLGTLVTAVAAAVSGWITPGTSVPFIDIQSYSKVAFWATAIVGNLAVLAGAKAIEKD